MVIPVSWTIFALSPLCASMTNSSSLEFSISLRIVDLCQINNELEFTGVQHIFKNRRPLSNKQMNLTEYNVSDIILNNDNGTGNIKELTEQVNIGFICVNIST